MTEQEQEAAWRQSRLQKIMAVKGWPAEKALALIEQEARWRPWEFVTDRVPVLKNLDKPSHR